VLHDQEKLGDMQDIQLEGVPKKFMLNIETFHSSNPNAFNPQKSHNKSEESRKSSKDSSLFILSQIMFLYTF